MDFLDPKKRRAEKVRLLVGYVLVAIAITLAAYVVVLIATDGFALKNGKIIQNGILFVASQPSGSNIYLNDGGQSTATTGARMTLSAGTYTVRIARNGYRDWQRTIALAGDSVMRVEYPFLFPTSLTTSTLQKFTAKPSLASQSINRRWLLVEPAGKLGDFSLYDLNTPARAASAKSISLPAGALTAASTTSPESLSVVDWGDDNRHVLLKHTYDKTAEYILLDTQNPSQSQNLNKTFKSAPSQLTLQNKKYNQYYMYNAKAQTLSTATLSNPVPAILLRHVVSYATYGSNTVLYATSQNAPAGQTNIMLYQNGQNYTVRTVAASSAYLLALTQYDGSWYIATGSESEGRAYVYQNPLDVLAAHDGSVLVPVAVLKTPSPNYVSFSASGQFVMVEHANSFSVYDVQYQNTYNYMVPSPLDAPQPAANWMDADRLDYVSHGQLTVVDYDGTNRQTLVAADPAYLPFFDPNYKYVYSFMAQPATAKTPALEILNDTALRTPADL